MNTTKIIPVIQEALGEVWNELDPIVRHHYNLPTKQCGTMLHALFTRSYGSFEYLHPAGLLAKAA